MKAEQIASSNALGLQMAGPNQNMTTRPSGTEHTILNDKFGMGTTSAISALTLHGSSPKSTRATTSSFASGVTMGASDLGSCIKLGGNATTSSEWPRTAGSAQR